jgi:DNA-binding CsgD family transcriptional regulator
MAFNPQFDKPLQTYVNELLSGSQRQPADLIEPMSARKIDQKYLLSAGYSTPQIAGHFPISINTKKAYVKSIYT